MSDRSNSPGAQALVPFAPRSTDDWRARLAAAGKSIEGLRHTTRDGLEIEPLHGPEIPPPPWATAPPGRAPYARGTVNTGSWLTLAERSEVDPIELSQAIAADRTQGVRGFVVRLDGWIRAGIAPDVTPLGREGAIVRGPDELASLATALAGELPVLWDCGAAATNVASALSATGASLGGGVLADPLGVLAETGTLAGGLERAYDALAEATAALDDPERASVLVATDVHHDAGATPVREIAIALATGVAYLRALATRGLGVDASARRIVFRFAVGSELFGEIAKLRAARALWAAMVRRLGGGEPAQAMRLHVGGSWRSRAALDPWVDLLRGTVETFVGAAVGAEAVVTLPFSSAHGEPDPLARRLAVNTQHVLRHEGQLDRVADPAGGSWYVERLTALLAEHAWSRVRELEAAGGVEAVLRSGELQADLAACGAALCADVASRRLPIVGVSAFPPREPPPIHARPSPRERVLARPCVVGWSLDPGEHARVRPLERRRLDRAWNPEIGGPR